METFWKVIMWKEEPSAIEESRRQVIGHSSASAMVVQTPIDSKKNIPGNAAGIQLPLLKRIKPLVFIFFKYFYM